MYGFFVSDGRFGQPYSFSGLWIKKSPVVGVVYNAIYDEMFSAVVGEGAKCNEKPIHVSGITELNKSVIICEAGARSVFPLVTQSVFLEKIVISMWVE